MYIYNLCTIGEDVSDVGGCRDSCCIGMVAGIIVILRP